MPVIAITRGTRVTHWRVHRMIVWHRWGFVASWSWDGGFGMKYGDPRAR